LPCESESGGSLALVDVDGMLVIGQLGRLLVSVTVRCSPFRCGPDVAQAASVV
jgi:hypothetical protein